MSSEPWGASVLQRGEFLVWGNCNPPSTKKGRDVYARLVEVSRSTSRNSHRSDTGQISWGNSSCLPCTVAESTRRVFDGIWTSRYVAHSSDAHALYPVLVHRLARLLDASFRPCLAAIALASLLTLHLHQVG